MADDKPPAWTVWTLQRIGREFGEWHMLGTARPDAGGDMLVYLKDLPIGGFSGFLRLRAPNKPPPDLPKDLQPASMAELASDAEDADEADKSDESLFGR